MIRIHRLCLSIAITQLGVGLAIGWVSTFSLIVALVWFTVWPDPKADA